MNPFQHGEVYVLERRRGDRSRPRPLRALHQLRPLPRQQPRPAARSTRPCSRRSGAAITSAKPCRSSRTSPTKSRRASASSPTEQTCDVVITEIGGTTGDIEGLPFLEAIRQFVLEVGPQNVVIMHVTLVPYIKAAGELKTKPTQQCVAKLREIGLQPQVLDLPHRAPARRRGAPEALDVLQRAARTPSSRRATWSTRSTRCRSCCSEEGLDDTRLRAAPPRRARRRTWRTGGNSSSASINPKKQRQDRRRRQIHRAAGRLQKHLRIAHPRRREPRLRHRPRADRRGGARGRRRRPARRTSPAFSFPAASASAASREKSARRNSRARTRCPILGLCLGMQVATIEFARNVCGLDRREQHRVRPRSRRPGHLPARRAERRARTKAPRMRLGTWPTKIAPGTLARTDLRRRRSPRAASAPLRVQHEVPRADGRQRASSSPALRPTARSSS